MPLPNDQFSFATSTSEMKTSLRGPLPGAAPRTLRCPVGAIDSDALQALLVDAVGLVLPRAHALDAAVDEHVVLERPAQLAAHVAALEAPLGDLDVEHGR